MSEYFFNLKDIFEGLKKLLRKVQHAKKRDWLGVALLASIALLVYALGWSGIFFWPFFVALFYWKVDARVSFALALFFLVLIPILLTLARYTEFSIAEYYAEIVAVWVYFFLCIGVFKQIVELFTKKESMQEAPEETHTIEPPPTPLEIKSPVRHITKKVVKKRNVQKRKTTGPF